MRWVWQHLPFIRIIDFPWRILGVTVFAVSLLSAYLVVSEKRKVVLSGLLLFFVFYANRNHLRINQTMIRQDEYFLNYLDSATWRNEFLPKWRQTNKWQHLDKDFRIRSGDLKVKEVSGKTTSLSFLVEAKDQGILDIHRLYFPGWEVFLDGKPIKLGEGLTITGDIQSETKKTPSIDRSGLLSVSIPEGKHLVEANFRETPLRKLGFILSLTGLGCALILTASKKILVHSRKISKVKLHQLKLVASSAITELHPAPKAISRKHHSSPG